jgi:predicted membrane protein
LPHLALAPVLFFTLVTFLHELAHAVAAVLVGGRVTELSFLPGAGHLGYMRWEPPPAVSALDSGFVSVAPYLMWSALALLVAGLAFLRRRWHWIPASTLFVWGYAVPVGDIAFNLYAGHGDLAVGGTDGLLLQGAGTLVLAAAYLLSYPVQRRLFGERALRFGGYLLSTVVLGAGFGVAALAGLALFGGL